MSIGVVYTEPDNKFKFYTEDKVGYLIRELESADIVVGYNLLEFDYKVLSYYANSDLYELPTVDMMIDVNEALGRKRSLKLENVAMTTLGYGKTEQDATIVFEWYKKGQIKKIAEYCKGDVKVTRDLYHYGKDNGMIYYTNSNGEKKEADNIRWKARKAE
jgi:DEAD/DEAH box helicase domain-containing protein